MSGTVVRKIIHSAFAPAAIGPYRYLVRSTLSYLQNFHSPKFYFYSQAVLVDKTLYVSGQLGLDTATGALVPGGVEAEAKRALDNMGHILQAAGISYNNGSSSSYLGFTII